jgi:hypothetical protein
MRLAILFASLITPFAIADVYPDDIPAQQQHPNCGTMDNMFKMGQLLLKTPTSGACHHLRWPGVKYVVEEKCICIFYR